MAIQITFDTGPLINRIDRMIADIDHFKRVDLGAGLSEFQTEDLNRHRPFTMRSRGKGTAATKIRPHSLYEMEASVRSRKRIKRYVRDLNMGKRVRPKRAQALQYLHTSTRDILRAEMYSVLWDRMTRIFHEKLTWASEFKAMYGGQ